MPGPVWTGAKNLASTISPTFTWARLIYAASAGDCPVHPLSKKLFLTGAQDSHLQTVTIPEAAYIQLRRRPPEDEQGNARNM